MFDTKKFFRIIIGVVVSVLIGTGLMIFTYSLPTERVVKNIQDGLRIYESEGNYPSWGSGEHSKLDNFTDAIMLLNATYPVEDVVRCAMLNPRYRPQLSLTENETPVDTLIQVMHGDTEGLTRTDYPRYWHGYLVILKPMLLLAKVNHVRMLMSYVDFILFVVALLTFQKVMGIRYALAFAAMVMVLNLVSVSMSFQYSSVYALTMLTLIIMLKKNRRLFDDDWYPYLFAAVGIVLAFTDFLTYPIFSVAMPLTVWYLLNRRELEHEKIPRVLKMMFGLLTAWGIGYAGMWSGKWFIAQILTGENILMNGLHQVMVYTQATNDLEQIGWQLTWFSAIPRNIAVVGHGPIRIFIFAAIIFLVYLLIRHRGKISLTSRKFLPYLLPAALPFAWYLVASGHSHIHAFFAYRSLAATIFALTCAAFEIFTEDTT